MDDDIERTVDAAVAQPAHPVWRAGEPDPGYVPPYTDGCHTSRPPAVPEPLGPTTTLPDIDRYQTQETRS